jgi:hypothetical protein
MYTFLEEKMLLFPGVASVLGDAQWKPSAYAQPYAESQGSCVVELCWWEAQAEALVLVGAHQDSGTGTWFPGT